jgi:GxxExxY protein
MAAKLEHVNPELTHAIIGSGITVHRALGPGLLESTYRACFLNQLAKDGLKAQQEIPIPLEYNDLHVRFAYRADIIVEGQVVVELKAVETLLPVHEAQLLTYLKHSGLRVGLLMNFNVPRLVSGVHRFVI